MAAIFRSFLNSEGFKCFKSYELDQADNRPFYVVQNVKISKRSKPKDCKLIGKENLIILFLTSTL